MWRDRWSALGVVGAALACLTPVAVLVLGAVGLGAWTGRLDLVLPRCSQASWGWRWSALGADVIGPGGASELCARG